MCLKPGYFLPGRWSKQEDFRCLPNENDDGINGGIMKTVRHRISWRYNDNMTRITGILLVKLQFLVIHLICRTGKITCFFVGRSPSNNTG